MDVVSYGKACELGCKWPSFSYLVEGFFCLIKEQEEVHMILSSLKCWDPLWSCVKQLWTMMVFWLQSQTSLMITSKMFISSLLYSSSVAFYHFRMQNSMNRRKTRYGFSFHRTCSRSRYTIPSPERRVLHRAISCSFVRSFVRSCVHAFPLADSVTHWTMLTGPRKPTACR